MYTPSSSSHPAIWGRYVGRLLCVLTLSIGLAACGGGSDGDDSSTTPEKPEPPTPAAVIHCAP